MSVFLPSSFFRLLSGHRSGRRLDVMIGNQGMAVEIQITMAKAPTTAAKVPITAAVVPIMVVLIHSAEAAVRSTMAEAPRTRDVGKSTTGEARNSGIARV